MLSASRGLAFDDVLLMPGYNGIKSRQNVTTQVSLKNLKLEIPLVSSNMDTITGAEMANAMGSQGGMALLHRFQTIEENVTALGTLQPLQYVDVGTQVTGQLKKLLVHVGDTVKQGQLLAEIDPTVYLSRVDANRERDAARRFADRNHMEIFKA